MTFTKFMSTLGVASVSASILALAPVTTASAAVSAATTTNDVRVGSFNLFGVNNDAKAGGNRHSWYLRRPVVARQILARQLDVVGLQEANQSTIYRKRLRYATTQFNDLKGELNARGGNYRLTNTASYNCANPASTYRCVVKNQNATGSTRIVYNASRLDLVKQGGYQYRAQSGKSTRFLAWGVFRVKSTGAQFLFTDTHLDSYNASVRQQQWSELIAQVKQLKGSLPVVSVGDFNTSKFDSYAPEYLTAMRNNGFGDVVNQRAGSNTLRTTRSETMVRAWISSYNGFRRRVTSYSYAPNSGKIGNGIDWVFASNSLEVKRWEVVADLTSNLDIKGVIPSDHHLVVSTLSIP